MKEGSPSLRPHLDKSASVKATNRSNCGLRGASESVSFSLLQDVPPACVSPQRDCPPPAQVCMSGRGHSGLSTPVRTSQSCWPFIHLLLYKKNASRRRSHRQGAAAGEDAEQSVQPGLARLAEARVITAPERQHPLFPRVACCKFST